MSRYVTKDEIVGFLDALSSDGSIVSSRSDFGWGDREHAILTPNTVSDELVATTYLGVIGSTAGTHGAVSYTVEREDDEDVTMTWDWAIEEELHANIWLEVNGDFDPNTGLSDARDVFVGYVGNLGIGEPLLYSPINATIVSMIPGVVSVEFDLKVGGPPANPGDAWSGPKFYPGGINRRLVVKEADEDIIVDDGGRPSP